MIVAFIPSKKYSSRLRGKNRRIFKGKPLFQHSIEIAKKSKKISRVFISSDDKVILRRAKKLGCETIVRPKKLSKKNIPMNLVIRHFVDYLKKNKVPAKTIVLLQPTSPFRKHKIIDKLLFNFFLSKQKTLVTVKRENNKFLKGIISTQKKIFPILIDYFNSNDQELPKFYIPNGSVYIFDVKKFQLKNSIPINDLIIYEMHGKYNTNIDTINDLKKINNEK